MRSARLAGNKPKPRFRQYSLLAAAYRERVPVTVHEAIGTDIIHAHPAADDPGGEKVQGEVAVAELDRVAGVVPPVVAGDDVEPVGEKVDDLPLPLVAPLTAQDRHDFHG